MTPRAPPRALHWKVERKRSSSTVSTRQPPGQRSRCADWPVMAFSAASEASARVVLRGLSRPTGSSNHAVKREARLSSGFRLPHGAMSSGPRGRGTDANEPAERTLAPVVSSRSKGLTLPSGELVSHGRFLFARASRERESESSLPVAARVARPSTAAKAPALATHASPTSPPSSTGRNRGRPGGTEARRSAPPRSVRLAQRPLPALPPPGCPRPCP